MKRVFGLIGYPIAHSYSKDYFEAKFIKESIVGCVYQLFPLKGIDLFPALVKDISGLEGLNVTIPYKQTIIPYLTILEPRARSIGAVNVVKIRNSKMIGFNSDYSAFKESLSNWLRDLNGIKAMVFGSGGASKAITSALHDLSIKFIAISREFKEGYISFETLNKDPTYYQDYKLLINATPVGTIGFTPKILPLKVEWISKDHYYYDLVYNPLETELMALLKQKGVTVKNGLEMLYLQADKSWEIWNNRYEF